MKIQKLKQDSQLQKDKKINFSTKINFFQPKVSK
jgi:hypothetical protein